MRQKSNFTAPRTRKFTGWWIAGALAMAAFSGCAGISAESAETMGAGEEPSASSGLDADASAEEIQLSLASQAEERDTEAVTLVSDEYAADPDDLGVSISVEPAENSRAHALRADLESLGLSVERIDQVEYSLVDTAGSRPEGSRSPVMIDAAATDARTDVLIAFTLGEHHDTIPLESIPFAELYAPVDVPGAEALYLVNEEFAQFVVVREGGGPLVVATVSATSPGEGGVLPDAAIELLKDEVLRLLISY
nr:hypothetical protein [Actinomycetales bacterium]